MKSHQILFMVWVETDEKTNDLMARQIRPEMWKHMYDASKRKEKQTWAVEKPKLANARRLRGIYFIDPEDEEFKFIMKMLVEVSNSDASNNAL